MSPTDGDTYLILL